MDNSILNVVFHIFNGGACPKILNHTHTALIPKIKKPEKLLDFRPI